MYVIGFTAKFYTLWSVNSFLVWITSEGVPVQVLRTTYRYIRNLSFDLDKAKAKLDDLELEYKIDTTLHGEPWFYRDAYTGEKQKAPEWNFSFGRLKGTDIRTAGQWILDDTLSAQAKFDADIMNTRKTYEIGRTKADAAFYSPELLEVALGNLKTGLERELYSLGKYLKDYVWQLERAMREETSVRRKVYARRRLIELGALVRRVWFEKRPTFAKDEYGNPDFEPLEYTQVRHNWMPVKLAEWYEQIGDKKGLFYEAGKRMSVTVKLLRTKMSNSDWGVVYTMTFITPDDHIVTYRGNKALDAASYALREANFIYEKPLVSSEEFTTVMATVVHKYGETFIQRLAKPKTQII